MIWNKLKRAVRRVVRGIGKIISGLVDAVVDAFSFLTGGMFDMPDMGSVSQAQAEAQGVLINKSGSLNNVPVVYGQRKVGGTIAFVGTDGDRNENLYMAIVLSEGAVHSIADNEIYIDGIPSTDKRFNPTGTASDRLATIYTQNGTPNAVPSALGLWVSDVPGWTTDHRLAGLAVLYCKFVMPKITTQEQQDANPWQGMPKVQAVIKGKRVLNCSGLDNTYSGDYATEYWHPTSGEPVINPLYGWSNNPADIILDFLRNPIYGAGLSNDRIDWPSFSAARARYAAEVTYADGSKGPLHEINAVIDTGNTVMDNLKKLLVHCRSGLPYVQGRFKLKLQDTANETDPQNPTPTSVFNITEDHLFDGMEIRDNGIRSQANQVRVTYVDPSNNEWTPREVIYPAPDSARDQEMLAEDGGQRVLKEYTLEYCTNANIAGYLAKMICENERQRKSLGIVCTSDLHEVEVGDVVTLTYDNLGINGNYYKVVSHDIRTDYSVALGLIEHNAQNYVFDNKDMLVGTAKQKQYVGNRPSYKYKYGEDDDGYVWTPEPVTPDPNLPDLPDNDPWIPEIAIFYISGITSVYTLDRPSIQLETVEITTVIPDWIVDTVRGINIEKYNETLKVWEAVTSINPGVSGVGSSTYKNQINIDLNGRHQLFRVNAYMNSENYFHTEVFSYTAGTSQFATTLGGTV